MATKLKYEDVVLAHVMNHNGVSQNGTRKATGIPYLTARNTLRRLQSKGMVDRVDSLWFSADKVEEAEAEVNLVGNDDPIRLQGRIYFPTPAIEKLKSIGATFLDVGRATSVTLPEGSTLLEERDLGEGRAADVYRLSDGSKVIVAENPPTQPWPLSAQLLSA